MTSFRYKKTKRPGRSLAGLLAALLICPTFFVTPASGQEMPENSPPAGSWRSDAPLAAPVFTQNSQMAAIQPPPPNSADRVLPINLPTALCLSQARPLVIALAQTSVEKAAAQLQGARALWLPDINVGV